jgi:hypothetical protein
MQVTASHSVSSPIQMVTWFIAELQRGSSRVQQMIMGAGKTTVVGPLLCLMLADGHTLVTQVMPTPLLEQTRNVLRSRFNVIVTKPGERIHTFIAFNSVQFSASYSR